MSDRHYSMEQRNGQLQNLCCRDSLPLRCRYISQTNMWGNIDEDGCGGRGRKGTLKRGWMDCVKVAFRGCRAMIHKTGQRWQLIRNIDPHIEMGKGVVEEEEEIDTAE